MAGSFDRRRALQILVLAIGCVALAGLPRPGGPAHQRGLPYAARESAAVGAGATIPGEHAGSGTVPTGAVPGMSGPLPAGGSGSDDARGGSGPEGQPPRSEMPALRDVNIPTTSRLPVRYTLGGGMTQALVLPAAAERVGQDGKSDSPAPRETGRPWPLVPLYISTTALQMLDVVSTQRALAAGGSEANPFVAPLVGSTPTMVAVKAGVSGAMIYAVEHLWKQNRKAAILMLLGTNIGYAVVVAHNFALTTSAPPTR